MIGFGTPGTQDFARFDVIADTNSGMYGAWTPTPRIVETPIVGSMTTEVQITHVGLAKLNLRLQFDDREDYFKLQSMLLKRKTLVLIKGFVPHTGEAYHWQGRDYEQFPATLLASLVPNFGIDDTTATASFWRAPDRMGVTL